MKVSLSLISCASRTSLEIYDIYEKEMRDFQTVLYAEPPRVLDGSSR